jgi:chromosome segregation and condensation protein ScpB
MDDELARPGRGRQLREIAGKWQLEPRADREEIVSALRVERGGRPLLGQALETLAAVALRQPVSTEEVTTIWGAESYATLETLRRRRLIVRVDTDLDRSRDGGRHGISSSFSASAIPAEVAQSDRMAGSFRSSASSV